MFNTTFRRIAFGALASALLLGGAAIAQIIPGNVQTSPVAVPGAFSYLAGPQASVVRASGGTFTCSGGTATVTNSALTANSVILFGLKTTGGTKAALFQGTVTPGTGFTVTCGGSDTSTYNYFIMG